MQPPLPLSCVIISKNEADRIGRCLTSVRPICSEVLVLDSGSDDDTVSVARALGARVEHQDWLGFAAQKNEAISRSHQPWILLMDADEWLADGAERSLRHLFDTGSIEEADIWTLKRYNWFLGGRLRRPEKMPRLIRADVRFLPMQVHERLDLEHKRVRQSDIAIEHNTARSWEDHLKKQDRYAELWATQRHQDGLRCGALSAWTHVIAYWLKSYILRAGFLDGRSGWLFHVAHARAVLRKYRMLHALGKRPSSAPR